MSICFRLYTFSSYQSLSSPSFFPKVLSSLIFAPECCTVNTPSKELNLDLWLRTDSIVCVSSHVHRSPALAEERENGISIDGWYLALIRQAASWAEDIREELQSPIYCGRVLTSPSTFKWDSLTHTAHNLWGQCRQATDILVLTSHRLGRLHSHSDPWFCLLRFLETFIILWTC